jgi:hypothetical protein
MFSPDALCPLPSAAVRRWASVDAPVGARSPSGTMPRRRADGANPIAPGSMRLAIAIACPRISPGSPLCSGRWSYVRARARLPRRELVLHALWTDLVQSLVRRA